MDRRGLLIVFALVALLAADTLFIAHNVASIDGSGQRRTDPFLYLGGEWTLPEIIQYSKWALLAGLLAPAYYLTRRPIYVVWAAAFAAMTLDDSLYLHERIGRVLTRYLQLDEPSGYLELVPMAVAAVAVVAALWFVYRRPGTAPGARRYTRVALALGGLYAFFAVGVDVVHVLHNELYPANELGHTLMQLLEEGGEMISASLMLGYTAWHLRGSRRQRPLNHVVARSP